MSEIFVHPGCFQRPSFQDHVIKKRWPVASRDENGRKVSAISTPKPVGEGGGGRESGESLSAPHHHRVSGVETVVTLYERANIDIYALLLNSKKRTLFECQCV